MDADLVYENIKSSEDSPPRRRRRRSAKLNVGPQADHRICPHWLWIGLWLSCSGNVLLAVIAVRVYDLGCSSLTATNRSSQNSQDMTGISNAHQCKQVENKTNRELEKLRTCLRQHLCDATNALTENGSCSICPVTWLLYEDKCYWFSTSIQSWNQSYRDCTAKRSQLLVISSTGEQEFIKDVTEGHTWIGLKFKLPEEKWMWVDGSPLNHTLSKPLTADCGILGKRGIDSDICSADINWICQKPSVFI